MIYFYVLVGYCRVISPATNRLKDPAVLGVGLGLDIRSLTELLHCTQLGSACAAAQGADAAVLDGGAIKGPWRFGSKMFEVTEA